MVQKIVHILIHFADCSDSTRKDNLKTELLIIQMPLSPTEADAIHIAISEIIKELDKQPGNAIKEKLKSIADKKIAHAKSIGESGDYEHGVGVQILNIIK